jgi:hypothetical protein
MGSLPDRIGPVETLLDTRPQNTRHKPGIYPLHTPTSVCREAGSAALQGAQDFMTAATPPTLMPHRLQPAAIVQTKFTPLSWTRGRAKHLEVTLDCRHVLTWDYAWLGLECSWSRKQK